MKYFIIICLIQNLLSADPYIKNLPDGSQISSEGVKRILFQPVDFPCISCMRIISLYTLQCANQAAHSVPINSFQTFCESLTIESVAGVGSGVPGENDDLSTACTLILSKLVSKNDKYSFYDEAPAHACTYFQTNCEATQAPKPFCFSGFCDQLLQCVDCPYGIGAEREYGGNFGGSYNFLPKVCSGRGVCKLGFIAEDGKSGNGFCQCERGYKGLACEFKEGKGAKRLKFQKKVIREEFNGSA
jgi:hypothetical protein